MLTIKQKKWSKEETEYLIQNYMNISYIEIAKSLNRTYASIQLKLKRLGLSNRRKQFFYKKYNYNNIFKDINLISSYWAGFIMADGGIIKNSLRIELAEIDKCHLKRFLKDLQSDAPIRISRGCVYISINSKEIVKSLNKNFNITPNKTFTAKPPKLSHDNELAFLCGLIDGDGSIYKHKNYYALNLVGTKEVCNFAKNKIEFLVPTKRGTTARNNGNVFIIIFGGRYRTKEIFKKLKNNQLPLLKRKWGKV
jgi:hypothetical protein